MPYIVYLDTYYPMKMTRNCKYLLFLQDPFLVFSPISRGQFAVAPSGRGKHQNAPFMHSFIPTFSSYLNLHLVWGFPASHIWPLATYSNYSPCICWHLRGLWESKLKLCQVGVLVQRFSFSPPDRGRGRKLSPGESTRAARFASQWCVPLQPTSGT